MDQFCAFIIFSNLLVVGISGVTVPSHPPLYEHPPVSNVRVELVNKTSVIVRWEKPPNIVNHYIRYYQVQVRQTLHEMIIMKLKHVPSPVTHELVAGLQPEILYNLRVAIIYMDKAQIFGSLLHFRTNNANVTSYCLCDQYGSTNSSFYNGTCVHNQANCNCRQLYTGSHCSLCTAGHFRELHRPCSKCPCLLQTSDGECVYDITMRRARCTRCKPLRDGPLCEICARGYFKHPTKEFACAKCSCPPVGKHPGHCDYVTGFCTECPNGTVGNHCEACAKGWAGVAPFCHIFTSHALPHHSGLTLLASVIAVAAVAVAVGLGYWVMRLRARQKRLNAWSLELNRYELEHPGVVDSGSQSGLMMEEAVPAYGGAADVPFDGAVTAGGCGAGVGPAGRKDDQLIFRAARLQLRQAEPGGGAAEVRKGAPLA